MVVSHEIFEETWSNSFYIFAQFQCMMFSVDFVENS